MSSDNFDWQPLELPFQDSTFELFRSADGRFIQKKLRNVGLQPFWQDMKALFNLDLNAQIQNAGLHYSQTAAISALKVPKLVEKTENSLILEWIEGQTVPSKPDSKTLIEIAHAWGVLHQQTSEYAGSLCLPSLSSVELGERLELPEIASELCSPILVDFRWDQFYRASSGELFLMDIDALVWGPVEWEWVIWEYLIPAEFIGLWVEHYGTQPALAEPVRTRLREILFDLNALGWTDKHAWMNAPTYWPTG